MGMIRAVVFDLDDTLYFEQEYVASGFRAVAAALCIRSSLSENEIFTWLWGQFLSGAKGNNFDLLLRQFPELTSVVAVSDLITLYRTHIPRLALLEGIGSLIDAVIAAGAETGIITDGPPVSQSAKIQALGLDRRIRLLVKTDEWGVQFRKPHPRAYEYLAMKSGIQASECLYIGDNPKKDFHGARSSGWTTVRLRLAGQLHYEDEATTGFGADHDVMSVAALTDFVSSSLAHN